MSENGAEGRISVERGLELLAVLAIALSVIGLVAMRLGIFDAPPIWMASLLVTILYHRVTFDSPLLIDKVPAWHVLVVVVVGLLFRLTPDAYVLGNQDQGVYVNMAMHLARTGDLLPVDPILATITDPAVHDVYIKSNYFPGYLPGVYVAESGLVFQFYHLFPVWLALFGDGFGPDISVYGLTFLSLLSLLFFQRLAHLITGSASAGLVAGLILAMNPLHAFFSRFPVTEVPTLAFSLMAFTFLLVYWRRADSAGARRSVVLSVMAMAMLFMTRISGFMYLPFFLVLALSALLFDANPERRRGMLLWVSAVLAVYTISVLYGLKWSAPYAKDIYDASFKPIFGKNWKQLLAATIVVALASWTVVLTLSRRERVASLLRVLLASGAACLPILVLAFAALGLYKAYRLGFTDAYATDPWLGQLFKISHQGWRSVFSTTLVASLAYLSPFILCAFFIAAFKVKNNPVLLMLLFFVACFLGFSTTVGWKVYYQPYYARYMLSEFVPYLILFVVCTWSSLGKGKTRLRLGGLLFAGGLFSVALSAAQLGKSEHEGVATSIDHLAARFDSGDLVMIDLGLGTPAASELKTSLLFTEGLKVASASNSDLRDADYLAELTQPFKETYLITTKEGPVKGFSEVESVHFIEWAFVHSAGPPVALWPRIDDELRIMKYAGSTGGKRRRLSFAKRSPDNAALVSGWSTPESWGVWSDSKSGRLNLENLDRAGMRNPILSINGRVYVTTKAPTQRINVLIDGKSALSLAVNYPQDRVTLVVPLPSDAGAALELEIQTPDAISPAQLGYSGDTRALSFGLEKLELRENSTQLLPK